MDSIEDEEEILTLEEARKKLEAVSSFLEVHAQVNRNKRTLRIHHELDIQVERLEEIEGENQ
ncbi:hypothetical protein OB919_16020 [Halobacteria archaeon AArc-curdl1]|uniref:Uncharacterized protein n=1 Tax=Natronosalvus hydrolyticus TaxID=2979988 RepID=A0AAP2ZAB8_9EURY|nr:hypothetical protein [Halobacteria archaeon AArc-curdl1]